MTSIYETTNRLIGEHLDVLTAIGWETAYLLPTVFADQASNRGISHEWNVQFMRLVGLAFSLHQQHSVDSKGRCHICTKHTWWWRTRARPCTVYAALNFYLAQPDELVLPELLSNAEQTIQLPRLPNI